MWLVLSPESDESACWAARGLEARGLTPMSSQSEYVASNLTELPEGQVDEVIKLVAGLDGDDDVQNVYTNLA